MGKSVYIAEKPSVAQEFAKALHLNLKRKDGYLESDEAIVTWCVGHLVTMSYPEVYDEKYKRWSLQTLPFIPQEFLYEVIPGVKKQFEIVKGILTRKDVDRIYVCTDSGREGEYIYRLVEQMAGVKGKERRRVWIDSQTEEEILRGIREAKDLSAYDNLGNAAYLRAKEDYLMGINFSRLLTLKYGNSISNYLNTKYSVVSVGRVMTCVLGMVVRREREIREFVKTPFYRVLGKFSLEGRSFEGEWRAVEGSRYFQSPDLYKENGFKDRNRAEELKGDKIPVLYCTRGLFSQEGAGMLREKGIPARSLKGGYTGWLFQQMQKESKKGDSEETENEAMEQRRKDIELSIRKKFHKQLFSRFARGINDYELVKPGDKIAVCISGGKDSMLMAKLFQELKRHNKFPFELVFLVMDPGYNEANRAVIEHNAKLLGIPITVFETEIFDAVYNVEKSPCYLCARMRRGYLYSKAKELGCNKIALGHHYDDVIETVLMGMLYGAQVQTMMPKLHSTNFEGMQLIRPMYLIREDSIKAWRDYNDLHFIQCACKFTDTCTTCNNEETKSKRMEIKQLIQTLKKTNPFIESNIFKSVENVNLDTVVGYKQYGERHYFLENYDKMGELKKEELKKKEAAQAEHAGENVTE